MMPARSLLFTALFAFLFAACTTDPAAPSGNPDPDDSLPPSRIDISGPRTAQAGFSALLVAEVKDSLGIPVPVVVSWSSSDSTLIAVSSTGTVTAKRIGSAVITASWGGLSDTVLFTSILAPYTFFFPDTLSETSRRLILDAVQDAHAFHLSALARGMEDSTAVIGAASHSACAAGGAAAATSLHTVIFCLNNPGWTQNGPVMRQKIVQHEIFHAWQFEQGWILSPATAGATWLIEGSAELMGFRGIAARGLISMETALGCQVKESSDFATRQPPGLPALSAVESRQAFQSTQGPLYTHSMLAANLLAGTDLLKFRAYGDSIAAGVAWQTAFQQAFGKTTTTFYSEFPGYVSGLAVPATYACRM